MVALISLPLQIGLLAIKHVLELLYFEVKLFYLFLKLCSYHIFAL